MLPVSREEADPCIFRLDTPSAFPQESSSLSHSPPLPICLQPRFAGSSLPAYGLAYTLVTQLYHHGWSWVCIWSPPSLSFLSQRVSWQEHSHWGNLSSPSLFSIAVIWVPVLHLNSLRKLQTPIFSSANYAFIFKQMSHLTWKQNPIFLSSDLKMTLEREYKAWMLLKTSMTTAVFCKASTLYIRNREASLLLFLF